MRFCDKKLNTRRRQLRLPLDGKRRFTICSEPKLIWLGHIQPLCQRLYLCTFPDAALIAPAACVLTSPTGTAHSGWPLSGRGASHVWPAVLANRTPVPLDRTTCCTCVFVLARPSYLLTAIQRRFLF
jgi:hypothetical protein